MSDYALGLYTFDSAKFSSSGYTDGFEKDILIFEDIFIRVLTISRLLFETLIFSDILAINRTGINLSEALFFADVLDLQRTNEDLHAIGLFKFDSAKFSMSPYTQGIEKDITLYNDVFSRIFNSEKSLKDVVLFADIISRLRPLLLSERALFSDLFDAAFVSINNYALHEAGFDKARFGYQGYTTRLDIDTFNLIEKRLLADNLGNLINVGIIFFTLAREYFNTKYCRRL